MEISPDFRENRRNTDLFVIRTPTAQRTSQQGQVKRDLRVSGFVFALVLVGIILATNTDVPVFWLLIGPAAVAILDNISNSFRTRNPSHDNKQSDI